MGTKEQYQELDALFLEAKGISERLEIYVVDGDFSPSNQHDCIDVLATCIISGDYDERLTDKDNEWYGRAETYLQAYRKGIYESVGA